MNYFVILILGWWSYPVKPSVFTHTYTLVLFFSSLSSFPHPLALFHFLSFPAHPLINIKKEEQKTKTKAFSLLVAAQIKSPQSLPLCSWWLGNSHKNPIKSLNAERVHIIRQLNQWQLFLGGRKP